MERGQSRMDMGERNSHEPHVYAERTVTLGMSIAVRRERVTSEGAHEFRPIVMFGKEGTVIMAWVSLLGRMLRNHKKFHTSFQIASDSQALVMARNLPVELLCLKESLM